MKKLFVGVLCVILLLGLLPASALAAEGSTYNDGTFTYTELADGTLSITAYSGGGGAVVIPSSYDIGSGDVRNVTAIGANLFENDNFITSVTISSGIKSIGAFAFYRCDGFSSITIPSSVTSIGQRAFSDCDGLDSVTLSSGLTVIGDSMFRDCDALMSITIPSSVTSIGSSAFSSCSVLSTVTLSDGLTIIGTAMFQYSGVTSIAIPSSVTSIGMGAFYDCDNLGSVTLSSGLTVIGESMFEGCDAMSSITIPSSVTSIGTLAFSECSTLNNVTLSDGLTVLGTYMFYNCDALTSVTVPSSVTMIGAFALGNCGNLGSVTLSDGLETIGSAMFEKCTALASVTIPSSMTSIGNDAFESCSSLQKAVIYSKTATFGTNVFASTAMPLDGIYGFAGSTAEAYAASNQIPFHAFLEVTYNSQGGSAVADGFVKESGQKLDPPDDPTKDGHVFGGWYKEAACTNAWDFDTDTVTESMTLYAKWTELTLTSSDADGKIYTGGRITLTPSVDGGEWDWDEEYFSATFNSPATFTALKEGVSTVTYTVDGVSVTYDVTIEESELPRTGQNYMLLYAFAGGGVLCIAGAALMAKKRRGRA